MYVAAFGTLQKPMNPSGTQSDFYTTISIERGLTGHSHRKQRSIDVHYSNTGAPYVKHNKIVHNTTQ